MRWHQAAVGEQEVVLGRVLGGVVRAAVLLGADPDMAAMNSATRRKDRPGRQVGAQPPVGGTAPPGPHLAHPQQPQRVARAPRRARRSRPPPPSRAWRPGRTAPAGPRSRSLPTSDRSIGLGGRFPARVSSALRRSSSWARRPTETFRRRRDMACAWKTIASVITRTRWPAACTRQQKSTSSRNSPMLVVEAHGSAPTRRAARACPGC